MKKYYRIGNAVVSSDVLFKHEVFRVSGQSVLLTGSEFDCGSPEGAQAAFSRICDILQAEDLTTQSKYMTDDFFLLWFGGDCPVDGETMVEIQTRDGIQAVEKAKYLNWKMEKSPKDIISYRLAKQEAPAQKPERWVPKLGERYFVRRNSGNISLITWNNDNFDRNALESGNVFRTFEEAEAKHAEIIRAE
jgi:hypothetical protein